jgi:hypothetical protein
MVSGTSSPFLTDATGNNVLYCDVTLAYIGNYEKYYAADNLVNKIEKK